ncbi:MAG: transposase family protein [Nitrospirae bacterium]|nr:transposase family protein [Nitrospirota bacterium]
MTDSNRRIRILTIIDIYTRECLRVEVDTSINGQRITTVLGHIALMRGLPESIVVDHGPEFISNAMDAWAYERGIELSFIRPGNLLRMPLLKVLMGGSGMSV